MSIFRQVLAVAFLAAVAAPALAATQLTGAGSTFDYPFFSKAFYEYSQSHPDVTVNYQSIGSGGGIQQFTAKTVDFGASDVPMNSSELQRAGDPVIQIPVALGGVSVSYNVPGAQNGLRLTRDLIAQIFLGKVTNWNDSRIQKLNPHNRLPNMPIIVVHRSDGSGTTYIFTDFLSHVSGDWKSSVGTGKSVQWPAPSSVGGKGNEGVAGQIRNAPGSIGYVELAYALENHMDTAAVQNSTGTWVNCSKDSVRAAAASKPSISSTDFSIVDRPGAKSYPIAGYSWVMIYKQQKDADRGRMIHDVIQYLVGPGAQGIAGSLDYVPLPDNVRQTAQSLLKQMEV